MTTYANQQWDTMLNLLAGRDAPVELSRRDSSEDGPTIVYRSRLFRVDPDGSLIVERPSQVVIDKRFGNGDDIELLLSYNDDRLVATCTILETFIHAINPTLRVTCYRLSRGRRPKREQRREFYRVSVAAIKTEPVLLQAPGKNADEAPIQVKAQLVNLSGGGLGVSIHGNASVLSTIKRTRLFTCRACFDNGHCVIAPVRVAHISARGQDLLYLGLELQIDDPTQARITEDLLLHLCAAYQRAQLMRRKA